MRYPLLDGVRGIAAVFVLTRHTPGFWTFSPFRSYLAVDLFFLLSGFVIAHAYEERLQSGRLGRGSFVLMRLVRLYPMFLLSVALCTVTQLAWHWRGLPTEFDGVRALGVSAVRTAFYLPSHAKGPMLFPLNGVYWSLLVELAINVVYVVLFRALRRHVLVAIVVAAAAVLAWTAHRIGGLDGGFEWGGLHAATALARGVFGIFLGVLLYRHRNLMAGRSSRLAPWLAMALVTLVLASPDAGWRGNAVVDLACVVGVFPVALLVLSGRAESRLDALWSVLGTASYPLYLLHRPVGDMVHLALGSSVERMAPWSGVLLTVLLVVVCHRLETRVDAPVRRRLSNLLGGGRPLGWTRRTPVA